MPPHAMHRHNLIYNQLRYKFIFVMYGWTTDAISVNPIQDFKDKKLLKNLKRKRFHPSFNIMDNVALQAITSFLEEKHIGLQHVKPQCGANAIKKAI